MLTNLTGASIWSEDVNNLLPFYRDVLGLKVVMAEPPYYMLAAPSMEAPGILLDTHSEVRGRNSDPSRHMVAIESTDLDADFKRLKAAGVEFIEEPTSNEQMRMATLVDPEGNYVQLMQMMGG